MSLQRQEKDMQENKNRKNINRGKSVEQERIKKNNQRQGKKLETGKDNKKRAHRYEDDYIEDWDCVERRNRSSRPKSPQKEIKQSKKKKKSWFLKFILTILILGILFASVLYYVVGKVYDKMNHDVSSTQMMGPMKTDGVVNILLIGNDSRTNDDEGRSDAMILLSVSNKTKKIYMTSLLRDIYVEIPGHGGNRLNAAYAYGGPELLMETIEQNFDVDVNRYVLVNFEAFANLIDAVGGVELELSSKEIEYVNGYLVEYNMLLNRPQGTDNMDPSVSGLVRLNGAQALAYSRNRLLGSDFERTERQRKVLAAAMNQLPTAVATNPIGLINGIMPNLTTNLTQMECFRLSLMAPKGISYELLQERLPLEGTYRNATIRKMSVLEVDFETNKKYIQENIYGEGAKEE